MNARSTSTAALTSDDDEATREPQTLPPPMGARDLYSAPTRVGSLPEDLLAEMRAASRLPVGLDLEERFGLEDRSGELASGVVARALPPLSDTPPPPVRRSLARSLVIVAVFALGGALAAAAITLW